MGARWRAAGFGPRLLLAQALVILAGSITLLGVALLLAPGLFRTHINRSVGPIPEELEGHLQEAFARSTLISLLVGVLAAVLTGLAVSWYITRRVVAPVTAMARAATDVAEGRYDARVIPSGLGSEFDAVGRSFNQMARDLAAIERTRAEILRDLAHEFRTPLTTIRGYHEALADGVLPGDRATYAMIEAELSRVERLVADLARVSVAEERGLDLQLRRFPVADLLRSAQASVALSFEERGVGLSCEVADDCMVMVDADRLQEVLSNLLSNALRHTPAGGRVTLTAARRNGEVQIGVVDTGEGIAAEHLSRVFERFYRVDGGRSRRQGGSGIGLAIARALVQKHDGHIRAESEGPGAGSTFTVSLPVAMR